jgi:hypothetical protein
MYFRAVLFVLLSAASSWAQSANQENPGSDPASHASTPAVNGIWVNSPALTPGPGPTWPGAADPANQTTRPKAISYSNGYTVRRSIHKYASFATLPLFIAQFAVGQKLYDSPGDSSLRSAHSGLAAGTAVLFGINSVTGVWNLMEGRHDPNGRGRRLFHGILMLGADAGFVATAALAPGQEHKATTSLNDRRSTHRAVALTSMGVAAASYLYMLITR